MKAKVMVVDDTDGVRELIGTVLQRAGYEPVLKANAAQLLASFTEAQPDVEAIADRLQSVTDRALKKKGARVLLAQVALRVTR